MTSNDVFLRLAHLKREYSLPIKVQELLEFMQQTIKTHKNGGFIVCSSDKKIHVDPDFTRAFTTLTKPQQRQMLQEYIEYLQSYYTNKKYQLAVPKQPTYLFDVLVRQGTFSHTWKSHKVEIDCKSLKVSIVGNSRVNLDLHEFLARRSKDKEKSCFALEATNANLRKTLRIGMNQQAEFQKLFSVVKGLIRRARLEDLQSDLDCYEEITHNKQKKLEKKKIMENYDDENIFDLVVKEPNKVMRGPQDSQMMRRETTLVDELLEDKEEIDILQKIDKQNDIVDEIKMVNREGKDISPILKQQQKKEYVQELEQIKKKKDLDIFHKLLPDYYLQVLDQQDEFRLIKNIGRFRLLRHGARMFMYRLTGILPYKIHNVMAVFLDTTKYKQWNQQVQLGDMKIRIISQNSAIMYQKHRPYNKFYRARDFLYLRHVFTDGSYQYIVDKSIQNSHYPPFSNVIRGSIKYCVWRLRQIGNETSIVMEIDIIHEGFLTVEQQEDLTLKYLVGMTNVDGYLKQNQNIDKHIDKCFDLEWDIGRNSMNQSVLPNKRRKSVQFAPTPNSEQSEFTHNLCSEIESNRFYTAHGKECWDGLTEQRELQFPDFQQVPKFISDIPEVKSQIRQIPQPQLQPIVEIPDQFNLDADGLVILPQDYLHKKHKLKPVNAEYKPLRYFPFDNFVFKDEWKLDHQIGLLFLNEKKIQVQKNILKYILSKLGKNILSGKGITNISLPVDIFATESYLQSTAKCMGYAPKILEQACKQKDSLARMKYVVAFSISNSLGFVSMQKPFNPILGETFQGWLNGCPVYCQQLSHHPPITAFYLVGRGYKVYGNFEARMDLSINSGTGTNSGEYIVEFDDTKQKIHFMSPGGEVTGVTYGNRTFNFAGKALFFDYENCRFLELVMNPTKKGFFSIGKQQKQADYCQGNIVKVSRQWLQNFRKHHHKKDGPPAKHIVEMLGKVSGLWTSVLRIDGEQFYNINTGVPCIIEYEKYPLNSNSNYREDIIYLKAKDLPRAQLEKERLENVQRADRKLREKHGKRKKH